jgi:Tol biopolymer transport system component
MLLPFVWSNGHEEAREKCLLTPADALDCVPSQNQKVVMSGEARDAEDRSEDGAEHTRLDSWKEIAAYLKRDVTTVRRWEKREGLPVHRHPHDRRDSVYAFNTELDQWLRARAPRLANNGTMVRSHDARPRLAWLFGTVSFLLASALIAVLALQHWRRPPDSVDQIRFGIAPPANGAFGTVVLSADGRHLAFTALTDDGKRLLWVRPLDKVTATPLSGTDDAAFPFWSPDSRSIGFFAQGKLRTVTISGGMPHVVCDAPAGRGGSWSRHGVILFSPGRDSALHRVPASGGTAVPVTTVARPLERGHLWPEFLPDGRHFLYLADSTMNDGHGVYVAALDVPEPKRLLNDASNVAYTRDGYLLFARERRLVAQRFDTDRLALTGEPVNVVESVAEHFDAEHLFDFSVSANGMLAHRTMPSLETHLVWRDRSNAVVPFAPTQALYADPTLSPDGKRVVVDIFDPLPSRRFGFALGQWTSDLWLFDVATGARSRFTFDQAADFEAVWSPDSARLVFASNRGGSLDLYTQNVSGGAAELLLRTGVSVRPLSWSPDGRFILYASLDARTRFDVWMLPTFGKREPVPLLRTEFNEHQASVSPNGRWLLYTSTESGRNEVYVQGFPSLEGKWQISTEGGGDPRWRPDGGTLFYIGEDRALMEVAVKPGATFEAGGPQRLFDTGNQPGWAVARNHYDVSRDGRRFLVMTPIEDGRSSSFTVVMNWNGALNSGTAPR